MIAMRSIAFSCLLSLSASNCSAKTDFSGNNSSDSNLKAGESDSKVFTVGSDEIKGPVDIVWVIDESGSMRDDVERVHTNLEAFERDLEEFSNVKSLLSDEAGWGVQSTNGPQCFLKALGIEIKSLFFPRSFISMIAERFSDCDDQLKDFFREKSKKVVIFVTDDNSRMLPEDFFDALSETPYSDIIFHAFASTGITECPSQAREGLMYRELIKSSKGQLYNLCEEDWTKHYEQLTNNIKKSVISEIDTDIDPDAKIIAVLVNNEPIPDSSYDFIQGKFKAKEGVLKENDEVEIKYDK